MTAIPAKLGEALADRYTIEKEIGAGGMAIVYLALDLRHRRRVAIKVFRSELAESIGAERFLREIEVVAGLTHPHILPLHDSGAADGILYYVMPFIEGESLRERLAREGSLAVVHAVRIFRDVVEALGHAHEKGVVHRDVKPGNVLLSGGHGTVADFGVARALRESADAHSLTATGIAIGTPQYMAPEQAVADEDADHRADLFAAGIVAYEMLTGLSPFEAKSTAAVFGALMTKSPEPPHTLREAIPEALSDVVMACLEKDPDRRPQSAAEVLAKLDALVTPTGVAAAMPLGRSVVARRSTFAIGAAAVVLLLAVGAFGLLRAREQRGLERWARLEAIPEVMRLADAGRLTEAAFLAAEAERVVGSDPVLETVWPRISTPFRVTSEPSGAAVSYRPYDSIDAPWRPVGTTPYTTERFPVGVFRFRIALDGFEALEEGRSLIPAVQVAEFRSVGFDYLADPSYAVDVRFGAEDETVIVAGGVYGLLPIAGYGTLGPVDIPQFSLDRTEVTNAAYQEFVAAGGYSDSTSWVEPFERDGRIVSWADAMQTLRDATGRPGPATWTLGGPPPGQDDYPVSGVSWYEAAAYCRWRGRALPTLFHWARAALPSADVWRPFNPYLVAASNLESDGPGPVASRGAVGVSGAHDLAGNVREWVSTPSGTDRFLMGGAWSDPPYVLHDQIVASPWVRLPTDGFRCASFPEELPANLLAGVRYPEQVFGRHTPMSDEVAETLRRSVAYPHEQPLRATVDSARTTDSGVTVEWVSVDTPYGERLPIRLHIPANAAPPYQVVVFFPGGDVIRATQLPAPILDFLVRSGRVLVDPVFDGTWQRNDGRTVQRLGATASARELITHWAQDLGRVIDYLEQRPDMDASRVGYVGLSFGAGFSMDMLAWEPRFGVAVLYSGGFTLRESQASIDRRSQLAERVTIPLLMLGGRHDFAQAARLQEELFRVFGTPAEHKRQVIFENAGHWPLPMNETIRETVDWLDRYLGPVATRP